MHTFAHQTQSSGQSKCAERAGDFSGPTISADPHGGLRRALKVGGPDDVYEQEADRVADHVMRMPDPGPAPLDVRGGPPGIQRACSTCGATCRCGKGRANAPAADTESGRLRAAAPGVRGAGKPLPGDVRSFFEPRFGHDFARVRVHADRQAAAAAHGLGARAFTNGRDIVFGAGEYSPLTTRGRRLLAHELTHVVQQAGGAPAAIRRKTGAAASGTTTTSGPAPTSDPTSASGPAPEPAAPPVNTAAVSPFGNCAQSNCTDEDRAVVGPDLTRASEWVRAARTALVATPPSRSTRSLLEWYFNSSSDDTIATLNKRLGCILDSLNYAQTKSWWGCDPPAKYGAYVQMATPVGFCGASRELICLTDKYFDGGPPGRAAVLIHEAAHLQGFSLSALSLPDIYSSKPEFRELTTAGALGNADSVAHFCRAVAIGESPKTRVIHEAGAGFGASNAGTTWAARMFVGAEVEHPMLGLVNPRLGVGITIMGVPLNPGTSTTQRPPPGAVVSALAGVRLIDPRPETGGTGFVLFEGGPSVIADSGARPGAELGVGLGYRWRMVEFSARLGTILDPKNPEGFRVGVAGTGGLGINF